MLRRIGPPTTADDFGMGVVGCHPSQPTLLDVCVLLAECLITFGQFDLRCSTDVLPVVPARECVSCYLRFSSRCCYCSMSDTIREQLSDKQNQRVITAVQCEYSDSRSPCDKLKQALNALICCGQYMAVSVPGHGDLTALMSRMALSLTSRSSSSRARSKRAAKKWNNV